MKKQLLALSVLSLVAVPAFASNFYLAVDAGSTKIAVDSESESDTTFSVGVGYQFNQYFAAELTYRDLGEVTAKVREEMGAGDFYEEKATLGFTALQAAVVASYPLGETSAVYGKLGMADIELDADYSYYEVVDGEVYEESASGSESKNKALFGIGYRHSFTPSFALRVEYTQYDDIEDLEVSTATIGLSYNF